jgi:hypothetical protein
MPDSNRALLVGSIFLINVPVAMAVMVVIGVLLPGSRDPAQPERTWREGCYRRPSDYEPDARRRPRGIQTDLACSRWMARRSRRLQKDRLDDQTDDQGPSD